MVGQQPTQLGVGALEVLAGLVRCRPAEHQQPAHDVAFSRCLPAEARQFLTRTELVVGEVQRRKTDFPPFKEQKLHRLHLVGADGIDAQFLAAGQQLHGDLPALVSCVGCHDHLRHADHLFTALLDGRPLRAQVSHGFALVGFRERLLRGRQIPAQ